MRPAGGGAALAAACLPGPALAHASEKAVILLLPTGLYIIGAGLAVALTAVLALAAGRLPAFGARTVWDHRARLPATLPSWLSALALAGLVAGGFLGSRNPQENLLPLVLWTLVWVGLTLAVVVFGDLWRAIGPWTGPVRTFRRLLGRTGGVGLARLGYLPAVAGYLGFAWFEIVSLSPDDPAVLARVAASYWLVIFVLAVAEGEDWLAKGEALTVYFGFMARIAPLWRERRGGFVRHMAGLPGAQVLQGPPLPPSGIAFITLVLAGVSFDGLSETFWWLGRIGINPLEFPGRSAVVGVNTAGLLAAWAVAAATILGAIALGRRLGGAGSGAPSGALMLPFLPIAAGYHVAHYLVALLTQGQYVVAALDDPLGRGWHLVGLPAHWVSFGFLADRAAVTAIWQAQVAVILVAHVLAVVLSLKLSAASGPAPPARAHVPVTLLMVAYTCFGLWLLSAPSGA